MGFEDGGSGPAAAGGSPAAPGPDPAAVRRRLLRWFSRHRRDFFWRDGEAAERLTPFQVLLVEFLLWKTNAARSHGLIRSIVLRYPRPERILRRSLAELERELRPLGLFRRRARYLLILSEQLRERHAGTVPAADPAALQLLTGVGQYAARATACLLAGSRLMPIDANTSRIFGRLHGDDGPPVRTPGAEWDERLLPFVPQRNPRRFLWATMDLGAAVCTAREPRCGTCPLRAECLTGRVAGGA